MPWAIMVSHSSSSFHTPSPQLPPMMRAGLSGVPPSAASLPDAPPAPRRPDPDDPPSPDAPPSARRCVPVRVSELVVVPPSAATTLPSLPSPGSDFTSMLLLQHSPS
jgi:hypothetical protein